MKKNPLQSLFKASALAFSISFAAPSFAQNVDEIIAVVGNNAILKSDLENSVAQLKQQLQAQNKNLPPEQILEQQTLEQLILREAQLEQVARYNVKPDERTLNEALLSIAKQSGTSSLEAFQKKVDSGQPGTYAAIRNNVAEDLAINQLRQQIVISRIKISDKDVENFLKSPQGQAALGNQVHVLHLRVSGNESQQKAVAEQVKQALKNSNDVNQIAKQFSHNGIKVEGADMGFRNLSEIPAELAGRVSSLDVGQTSELIKVNDGTHILKLLERKSSEQKALVPQYETRHILIQPSEVVSLDNAKQMIDSIYTRLNAGEDFAVLAATFSNDPGSARDGGSLGWVSPGVMVPEFEQQMKNTPVGQISKPFQTQ